MTHSVRTQKPRQPFYHRQWFGLAVGAVLVGTTGWYSVFSRVKLRQFSSPPVATPKDQFKPAPAESRIGVGRYFDARNVDGANPRHAFTSSFNDVPVYGEFFRFIFETPENKKPFRYNGVINR